jgi:trigger factor
LNSSLERLEGNRVRITVVHNADEVREQIAEAYTRIARQIKLPGFRPGKAPRPIIDTQVGRDYVLGQALENLVERSYPRALDALDLRPLDRPDTGTLDGLVEGEDYTYTAEVDVKPELSLSSIEGIVAKVPSAATTDAEIDAQIDYLRDRFATLAPVEDRGIADEDFVLLSFTGTVDGEAADDLTVDKYLYEVGRGIMPQEFDQGLVGAQLGSSVHIEFAVPDTAANPDYVGKTAAFDVDIHEIKAKALAEANDEFATNVGGFDTIEELRNDIRTKLDENKATAQPRLIERAAVGSLVERLEGEVPAKMIEDRTGAMTEEFFDSLKDQGMSVEDYTAATGLNAEDLYADIAREAALRVRDELALEALFRQAGLNYTDEELDREVEKLASAEKIPVNKMRERLVDTGVMAYLRERLVQRHAVRYLMDHVEIVEEAPSGEEASKPKKSAAKKSTKKADAEAPAGEEAPAKPKKAAAKKAPKKDADAAKEE